MCVLGHILRVNFSELDVAVSLIARPANLPDDPIPSPLFPHDSS